MEKVIKIEGSEYDSIRSDRFLVNINSNKLVIEDWLISNVYFDDIDKKILTIAINDVYNSKTKEYKLMPLLDKCMNDYTIVKDITINYIDAEGCIVYSEIFESCKVDSYRSSNLGYRDDAGRHTIIVKFKFMGHKVKTDATTD